MAFFYSPLKRSRFLQAYALEDIFAAGIRDRITRFSFIGMLLAAAALGYGYATTFNPALPDVIPVRIPSGLFLIFLSFFLTAGSASAFANAITGDNTNIIPSDHPVARMTHWAYDAWYGAIKGRGGSTAEIIARLPASRAGTLFLLRLGLSDDEFKQYLGSSPSTTSAVSVDELLSRLSVLKKEEAITLADLAEALFDLDKNFHEFLIKRDLNPGLVRGSAEWVEEEFSRYDAERRWWTKASLARVPSIGKNWSYGQVPLLQKHGRELEYDYTHDRNLEGYEKEIELLENALLRNSASNVIIVGDPGVGKHSVLMGLVRLIHEGKIFPQLENKRVFLLSSSSIVASGKEKGEVEGIIVSTLDEAIRAGNIILAVEDFPEFVESLAVLGTNVKEILHPYLSSASIQLIALANTQSFRRTMEARQDLLQYFERVQIREPLEETLVRILADEQVPAAERYHGGNVRISYQGLRAVADGALNYLVSGGLPRRAIDLLAEVMQEARSQNIAIVNAEFVLNHIEKKTNVPLGKISDEEQAKLMQLEAELHKRVIGQVDAIRAVSDAVRRSRAGLKDRKRPIGTFLFLGPTGVGKTETAKALAQVYFGNEENMVRFDMSEFQEQKSLDRLIGSFESNEVGILVNKMNASPYSIVLLDEFEKSHEKIRNLFLQILDEGFFTDVFGKRINMRNTIIIATSNAGSIVIQKLIKEGASFEYVTTKIISHIQDERIYTPELLNRFDAVIVFKPLGREELREVARIMLAQLAKALQDKRNMRLEITDELLDFAIRGGFDLAFGARNMRRFLQDTIEEIIAEKIIKGEAHPGTTFALTHDELEEAKKSSK